MANHISNLTWLSDSLYEGRNKPNKINRRQNHTICYDKLTRVRYNTAVAKIFNLLKRSRAVEENPMRKADIRVTARKFVPELDKLLKYLVGKVGPDGIHRLRRRHKADGTVWFWLETENPVRFKNAEAATVSENARGSTLNRDGHRTCVSSCFYDGRKISDKINTGHQLLSVRFKTTDEKMNHNADGEATNCKQCFLSGSTIVGLVKYRDGVMAAFDSCVSCVTKDGRKYRFRSSSFKYERVGNCWIFQAGSVSFIDTVFMVLRCLPVQSARAYAQAVRAFDYALCGSVQLLFVDGNDGSVFKYSRGILAEVELGATIGSGSDAIDSVEFEKEPPGSFTPNMQYHVAKPRLIHLAAIACRLHSWTCAGMVYFLDLKTNWVINEVVVPTTEFSIIRPNNKSKTIEWAPV